MVVEVIGIVVSSFASLYISKAIRKLCNLISSNYTVSYDVQLTKFQNQAKMLVQFYTR